MAELSSSIIYGDLTVTRAIFGDGNNITNLNASNLLTGTVLNARITGAYTGFTNITGSGVADFTKFWGTTADSATAPSFSFTADSNTGIWNAAADQLGFTTGGVNRLTISTTGIASTLNINAPALGVQQSTGAGAGLSLYGTVTSSKPDYGIMFATTANYGTYGPVSGDWATYFTMTGTNTRGWIFKSGTGTSGNVASISSTGAASFLTSVTSPTFIGNLNGNAATVTNGLYSNGSYANPAWLTSLEWSKITNAPTTLAGYGITNAYTKLEIDSSLSNKADLVNGLIPANQLPSYVDDVLEYSDLLSFPVTGESGKLYIAIDTNLVYRWSGTTYVVTSSSLALGETSTTAGRGDYTKTAYDHSQITSGNPHGTTFNSLVDIPSTFAPSAHTLDSHSNVTITSNVNGEILRWNGSQWVNNTLAEAGIEPAFAAGTTAQYRRGDKTWQTLNTTAVAEGTNLYFTSARVLANVLTGYAVGTNAAIAATDTVLGAFNKIQAQINARPGTVTSVAMTVPTGLSVTGSPITSTGTLALTLTSGYSIPTTAKQTQWDAGYSYSQIGHLPLSGGTITAPNTGNNRLLTIGSSNWFGFGLNGGYGSIDWFTRVVGGEYQNSHATVAPLQLAYIGGDLVVRKSVVAEIGTPVSWTNYKLWHEGDFNPSNYLLTTGNAASAAKLATARTIWGQSFDGTANVSGSLTGVTNITGTGIADFGKFYGNTGDSAAAPSFSWTGDTDMGIWHLAANSMGFSTGGVNRFTISSSSVTSTLGITAPNFISNIATGTAPFTVTSTTVVNNLNADMVDGLHAITANGSAWGFIPVVRNDGVMDVGRYIDFTHTSGSLVDYAVRLQTDGTNNSRLFIVGNGEILTNATAYLKTESDARYLQLTGGTLTGTLSSNSSINTSSTSRMGSAGGFSTSVNTLQVYAVTNSGGWNIAAKTTAINVGDISGIKLHGGYSDEIGKWAGIAGVAESASSNTTGLALYAGQTERVRISNSGNVGIGNIAPTEKLDVTGNGKFSGDIIAVGIVKSNNAWLRGNTTSGTVLSDQSTSNMIYFRPVSDSSTTGQVTINGSGTVAAPSFSGPLSGNATTATTLQTARTIALSGAATGTATSFNGSANITIPVTGLNASNLNAGTVPDGRLSGSYTGLTGLTLTNSAFFGLYDSSRTDITSTVIGSTDGLLIRGGVNAHVVVAIDGNDDNDSFNILAHSTTTGTGVNKTLDRSLLRITRGGIASMFAPNLTLGGNTVYHTGNLNLNDFALASHTHNAADINTGILADARLSGTYTGVNITGNSGTATKLATPRTINGVAFDGSANITISASGDYLPLTGGNLTGSVTINTDNTLLTVGNNRDIGFLKKNGFSGALAVGSTNVFRITRGNATTISIGDTFTDIFSINAANNATFVGSVTASSFIGNASSATTATILTTARTIWGQSFNGSANITGALSSVTNITGSGTVDMDKFWGSTADTAAAPSFSWTTNSNTGLWNSANNAIGFTVGGVNRMTLNNDELALTTNISSFGGGLTIGNVKVRPMAGPIMDLSNRVGGSGYTNGTYTNVATSSVGGGLRATLNLTVTNGVVSAATLASPGARYIVGDTLTIGTLGGTGSGFSIKVSEVDFANIYLTDAVKGMLRLETNMGFGTTGRLLGAIFFGGVDDSTGGTGDLAKIIGRATSDNGGTTVQIYTANQGSTISSLSFAVDRDKNATVENHFIAKGQFQSSGTDTAALPSFTWSSDTNTGIWRPAADQLGFTTGGTNRLTLSNTTLTGSVIADFTNFWGSTADTAAAPSFAFTTDSNTGIWNAAADSLGFTTGGTNRLTISTSAITSTLNMTAPSFIKTGGTSSQFLKADGSVDSNTYLTSSHNHTLDSLSNVTISSNSAGELLSWNGSQWINRTLTEVGIVPASSLTATLPATIGWYRIATSPVSIDRNAGRFEIDWTLSGNHGEVTFLAGIMYGVTASATITQQLYTNYTSVGLTQARIVYHTTYASNYAYIEVYNASAAAITLNIQLQSYLGWTLITPVAGSIPTGYTSLGTTFVEGLSTTGQLKSTATGMAPLLVDSNTMVTNLNSDLLDGQHGAYYQNATNLNAGTVANARLSGSYTGLTNVTGTGTADFGKFWGSTADTAAAPSFSFTADSNTGIWNAAADSLGFTTGGTNRLTIANTLITSTVNITAPTFNGSLNGNASSATKLATARTINGVAFDGTANINIAVGSSGWAETAVTDFNTPTGFALLRATAGSTANQPIGAGWGQGIQFSTNNDPAYVNQFVFNLAGEPFIRSKINNVWNSWFTLYHTGNVNPVRIEGSTMSGKLGIITGRAFAPASIGKATGNIHLMPGSQVNDNVASITFSSQGNSPTEAQAGIYLQGSGIYGSRMYFATTNSYAAGPQAGMYLNEFGDLNVNGKLGVALRRGGSGINSGVTMDLAIGDHDTGFISMSDGSIAYYRNGGFNYELHNVWHTGNLAFGSVNSPWSVVQRDAAGAFGSGDIISTGWVYVGESVVKQTEIVSPLFIGSLRGNATGIYNIVGDNDYIRITGGSTASNAGYLEIATADDGTEPIYVRQYSGTFTSIVRTATLLDASGNTQFPGDVLSFYSDRRLKTDFKPIENALEKVSLLNGYTYKANELAKEVGATHDLERTHVGLIAQEVKEVLPEAVQLAPFDVSEEGDSKSGEDYLTIQYEKIVPLLVEAVKELKDQVKDLMLEIELLKKQQK